MYDYRESIKADIRTYIDENFESGVIAEKLADRNEWEQQLNDDLWICDGVTGNASGSYTFNRYIAQEYVVDNIDLLHDMSMEFGLDVKTIGEKFLDEEWEYFDVSIRCYLLGECLNAVLDELGEKHGVVIPMF